MDNKIQVGITVSFLNELGKGKVIKILNNNQALILREDGFEVCFTVLKNLLFQKSTH